MCVRQLFGGVAPRTVLNSPAGNTKDVADMTAIEMTNTNAADTSTTRKASNTSASCKAPNSPTASYSPRSTP